MDYQGVIIAESLKNPQVLKTVKILSTKVEPITPEHKTPWLAQWTLHTIQIPEEAGEKTAQAISQSLDGLYHWYADFKNDQFHFIVYSNQIFKIDITDSKKSVSDYQAAKAYGISLGIPEYQVDFAPEDKLWQR